MNSELRVGQGWDRHRLAEGDKLRLGGVDVPADYSIRAHSDGDVVLHALIDALLGAAGLEDIGYHFPPSSERWEDADSTLLLKQTVKKIQKNNWSIQNIDLTAVVEVVKLAGFRDKMKKRISTLLPGEIPVNIKFKTAEKTGPVGKKQAVEAMAVVLLRKKKE